MRAVGAIASRWRSAREARAGGARDLRRRPAHVPARACVPRARHTASSRRADSAPRLVRRAHGAATSLHAPRDRALVVAAAGAVRRGRRAGAGRDDGSPRAELVRRYLARVRPRERAPTSPTGPACASPTSPRRSRRSSRCAASATSAAASCSTSRARRCPPPTRPRRFASSRSGTTSCSAFADRTRVLPEEYRKTVIAKNGDVAPDVPRRRRRRGHVARGEGEGRGSIRSRPSPAPPAARSRTRRRASRSSCADADRRALLRRREGRASTRRSRWAPTPVQLFTQSPRAWKPPNPEPRALRALPRAARGGGARRRALPRDLPRQPRRAERRGLREERSRRCAARWRSRARSRPTASSSTSARTSAPGFEHGLERAVPALEQVLELCSDRTWLLMENSAGRRRHDRPLDRGARDALRAARPPPAARRLPRLVPSLRLRLRRHRPGGGRRRARRARRRDRPRPAPLRCT